MRELRGEEFDVMGLAADDGLLYASGHPGPTQSLPDPLGVLVSNDGGRTWNPELLTGEVDFHLLRVAGDTMVGVAANYGAVMASTDRGETWSRLAIPTLTSLSLNPAQPNEILLVADGLLQVSTDTGQTFSTAPAPEGIFLEEWTASTAFVASSSTLYKSSTYAGPFVALPTTFNNVLSFGAHADALIVLSDQGVHISRDGGETFTLVS